MTASDKLRVRVGTDGSLRGIVSPASRGPRASYMRGNTGLAFAGWNPVLRDSRDEVSASWERAAARALDLIHNSGWIAGAVDQAVANTVGTGLRLSAMPDADALGMTASEASKWARRVERRFELWARCAYECDIEGKRTFGQMQAAALKTWFATGEIVAELPWKRHPGGTFGSKVRLVQPWRLAQRSDEPNGLFQGVRTTRDGLLVSYVFRRREAQTLLDEVETKARDSAGRVKVIHVFDGLPDQMRGITPLVPALQVARQLDQLADAHLTASLIRAAFAATIKSELPTEDILRGLLTPQEQARMASAGVSPFEVYGALQEGYYKGTSVDVGIKGRFAHLFPGEELQFHANPRTAACRAEWKGTPKPQADDLKTAKSHETYRSLGVITDEMICNDLGMDVEDVYEQLARERDMRAEFKLPDPGAITADPVADKLNAEGDK